MRDSVRSTELIARYGGEEFSLILPTTDCKSAIVVAERDREAVYAINELHEDNSEGIVTVSIGLSSLIPRPTI